MIRAWFDILGRLAGYFQVAGTVSVLAWLWVVAALAVFAVKLRRAYFGAATTVLCGVGLLLAYVLAGPLAIPIAAVLAVGAAAVWRLAGRTGLCLALVALAAAGVLLGGVNSRAVSRIEVDRTRERLEARRRQEELRAEKIRRIKSTVADVHFAEDTEADRLDLAGKTAEEVALLTGVGSRPADRIPEYKRRGKQQRTATKAGEQSEFDELAHSPASAGRIARMMPAWDVVRANRLDRVNLLATRCGLLLALLMLATDYVNRLNLTFGALLPVPLAGPVVDALAPKSHAVHVRSIDESVLRSFLETAVQKGETFIYLGPDDPFARAPRSRPRLDLPALLRRRGAAPARVLPRWPLGLRPLTRLVCDGGAGFPTGHFVFESAWFRRYCFVVVGEQRCRAVLAEVAEHLRARRRTGARARRTVNLLWHWDPPPEDLPELARLCRDTNFRLLVWSPGPPAPETADCFDEVAQPESPAEVKRAPVG